MDIEIQQQQHPNPQSNPHHRKIDLQSPHDLTYLQTSLANSALQKLDLHFPNITKPATHITLGGSSNDNKPNPSQPNDDPSEEEDPMRRRVHDLVSSFLHTTWTSASHNISVNGIDASTLPLPHTATLSPAPAPSSTNDESTRPREEVEGVDFTYAAFDSGLQRKVAALHGELEALTAQVSKLRRTAPGLGAERYQAKLVRTMEADEERFEREMAEVNRGEVEGLDIESVREGWNEDVREVYEQGVNELASLAGAGQQAGGKGNRGPTLTETVGKAQRARTVAMEWE